MQLTLRRTDLGSLISELQEQRSRQADVIVPSRDLWSRDGIVTVRGAETEITSTGVTSRIGSYTPSPIFDDGLASKLSFSRRDLRTWRETGRVDIIDGVVNSLLHGNRGLQVPADDRRFLLRTFTGSAGGNGYARALLSDSYLRIDHLEVLQTILGAMKSAGLGRNVIKQADLSDRRMYVRVVVPEISVLAPRLLRDYQSPFTRARGAENPVVFAGIIISNSETGNGRYTLTPSLEVQVCGNGMTVKRDIVGRTHLGGKIEETGVVKVSQETVDANLVLIRNQTRDAVDTFLNTAYMERVISRVTEGAERPVRKAAETVQQLAKRPAFTKDDVEGILEHFTRGGDTTRGGLLQAVTSFAQTIEDPDRAYAMGEDALEAAGFAGISGLADPS